MKKIIFIILFFALLAGIFFAGGALFAYKKNKLNSQKTSEKNVQNVAEDISPKTEISNEVSINAEEQKSEEQKSEPALSEPVPEKKAISENKFSFAILGDTQYFKPGAGGSYPTAANSIKKMNPNMVFALGDLVSSCDGGSECEKKYAAWKSILGPLASKTYPTQGNHDRTGKSKADSIWQKVFNLPTNGPGGFSKLAYSFDWENSHFVVLDSEKPEENLINDVQRSWLDKDLDANKKENVFVFFHEPAYPMNSKIDESLDVNPKDRNALWDIFVKHKVTAVFVGHEHIQARRKVNGIYQFTFGNVQSSNHDVPKPGMAEYFHVGMGFGLVEINGKGITVKTYGISGNILNSFVLSK